MPLLLLKANTDIITAADLMILALPIPIVWRLTLELRRKIILSVVFTLGSMYVFVRFVRAAVCIDMVTIVLVSSA